LSEKLNETDKYSFDYLVAQLRGLCDILPDYRFGKNKTYTIADAALGAFSVFFTQSPSSLAHQKKMQETKGMNNAESIFKIQSIPCNNQIRNLLDPIDPSHFISMYDNVYNYLKSAGHLEKYRSFNNTLLIPIDGIYYFSSNKL